MTDLHETGPARAPAAPQVRRVGSPALDRILRQVQGIDCWNQARRVREARLEAACTSRLDREVASRQLDALRRVQQVVQERTAAELARAAEPMRLADATTAVLAHRHEWFVRKLSALLATRGVTVLACTDNAADALALVITEQPDLLLAGDRLAMMPVDVLLADVELFAGATVRAVQVDGPKQELETWRQTADEVFLRHYQPDDVADVLRTRCRDRRQERTRVWAGVDA